MGKRNFMPIVNVWYLHYSDCIKDKIIVTCLQMVIPNVSNLLQRSREMIVDDDDSS